MPKHEAPSLAVGGADWRAGAGLAAICTALSCTGAPPASADGEESAAGSTGSAGGPHLEHFLVDLACLLNKLERYKMCSFPDMHL